jgi:hypothetical protein
VLASVVVLLHVATMFTIVALHSGPQILVFASRQREPAVVAAIADVYARTGRAVPPLGVMGGLLGLAAGLLLGYNLLAPWLLIAYGLFAVLVVYGGRVTVPYFARLGAAARANTDTYAELAGRQLTVILLLDALIYVLIVADMVLKPLS